MPRSTTSSKSQPSRLSQKTQKNKKHKDKEAQGQRSTRTKKAQEQMSCAAFFFCASLYSCVFCDSLCSLCVVWPCGYSFPTNFSPQKHREERRRGCTAKRQGEIGPVRIAITPRTLIMAGDRVLTRPSSPRAERSAPSKSCQSTRHLHESPVSACSHRCMPPWARGTAR